ncbi:carbohydrate kinase family protein [Turicibacter sanguinis]|uniref:carbohydrate kinase family protein n=1 Tax=Turicibacter sanguinis TaxID=154288 RepID=UPI0023300278|nr:carbohydrate kinase family protein [Turicibacter sanguinis]MDB8543733.1 carbohydrate kinase family protein [Turicibacter sanguinis]
MKKVLVIGGTTFDSIVYLDKLPQGQPQTLFASSPLNETLGSTGAGKALNLTKLGIDTTLHSVIGDDEYGHKIIRKLKDAGVNFEYDFDPLVTERHVNLLDPLGQRISIFVTQGSAQPALDLERLEKLIMECDIVVLNIISYTKQLIKLIEKHQKPIWTDLHDYNLENPYHQPYIEAANYIFVSSDNLPEYHETMLQWMSQGKELIVCTHGSGGATALTKTGEWIELPIISDYKFKDANGAGDSFFSGFLYAYLNGKSIIDCMKYATILGGLCISSYELAHEKLSAELVEQHFLKYYN